MQINGMPRPYLIKECRDKLNSSCAVKPTRGPEPGAQISFREFLIRKLKLLLKKGKLSTDKPIRVKISGDGARMTRLTNYVILSYSLLDDNDDLFCARGKENIDADKVT
ncbi:hypothetical protein OS493_032235 [Desmophyllum pertusum]|uniref:Uncharacterized protein n=1 Tax=Desmophyllum pertusum TaxID=174260 RepID=A0A9W9ZJU7_9CNID|nr:hypothetical protein OS493_032235 [Desmophyllum pertusum]